MTYKEFEAFCATCDYQYERTGGWVYVIYNEVELLTISTRRRNIIRSRGDAVVSDLLFGKVVELAGTPLEDREEPKKYYVKLVDREDGYINKTSSGELLLLNRAQRFNYQTKFTEEQIKAIDERYMAFAEEVE